MSYYQEKQSDVESARNLYNYAAAKLELAQIRCRLAEIESQFQPLGKLCENDRNRRDDIISAAYYVVIGRFPAESEIKHE